MLVKIFKINSRNREPGGLDYVLNNDTAKVLRGAPDFCRWVIASTPSTLAQRFTAGVINDLKDLPDAKNEDLLDEFEDFLLAGRNIRADVHEWLAARLTKGSRLN